MLGLYAIGFVQDLPPPIFGSRLHCQHTQLTVREVKVLIGFSIGKEEVRLYIGFRLRVPSKVLALNQILFEEDFPDVQFKRAARTRLTPLKYGLYLAIEIIRLLVIAMLRLSLKNMLPVIGEEFSVRSEFFRVVNRSPVVKFYGC